MKQITIVATEFGALNHGLDNRTALYNFLVKNDMTKDDVLNAIKAAATEYCQTDEGKKTYDSNCCNFNIGDLDTYVPDEICLKHGILLLKSDYNCEIHIDFNTQLVIESDIFSEE